MPFESYKNSHTLVTGGANFIGSHVRLRLLDAEADPLPMRRRRELRSSFRSSFSLMSSGVLPYVLLKLPYVLLNVWLSVAMLAHGNAILFLLWCVKPVRTEAVTPCAS